MKALVFKLLESTSLSSHRFQASTCTPYTLAEPAEASVAAGEPDYNWHLNWYPVAFIDDLVDDAPMPFTVRRRCRLNTSIRLTTR